MVQTTYSRSRLKSCPVRQPAGAFRSSAGTGRRTPFNAKMRKMLVTNTLASVTSSGEHHLRLTYERSLILNFVCVRGGPQRIGL